MSSSTSDDAVWEDFDRTRASIRSFTVDRLKQIITGLSDANNIFLQKSGRKAELVDRIQNELDKYRYMHSTEQWKRARNVLQQVQLSGGYSSTGTSHSFIMNSTYGQNTGYNSSYNAARPTFNGAQNPSSKAGTSSMGRYDPYAPPRIPQAQASTAPPKPVLPVVRFKASPFHRIEQSISQVVECPESHSSTDRRTASFQFSLTSEQISKLSQTDKKFQVRLYCTTSTFYTTSPTGFRSSNSICPIEFPPTCEVRVNANLLSANLKGIKKKPGTAPPADISKVVKMAAGSPNRVEMIYVNSQTGGAASPPKKYYLMVYLVEISTVDQLVDRLRKGKFKTADDVRAEMARNAAIDDDIELGKATLTLKCPLSYTRITVPARSEKCVHSQCFDAVSWYSVMEQTTTWLCPICEKMLNPEELIVDGFFESIVKSTPDSVDDVELEPDGEWHTADNKYGSQKWMDKHGKPTQVMSIPMTSPVEQKGSASATTKDFAVKAEPEEVLILDSDSESDSVSGMRGDSSRANGISSVSTRLGGGSAPIKSSGGVIDLTLDSDDDEPQAAPVKTATGKRKAAPESVSISAQKKGRMNDLASSLQKESVLNANGGHLPSGSPDPPRGPPMSRSASGSSPLVSHSPSTHSPPNTYPTSHLPRIRLPATGGHANFSSSYPQGLATNGTARASGYDSASVYNAYRPGASGGSGTWP